MVCSLTLGTPTRSCLSVERMHEWQRLACATLPVSQVWQLLLTLLLPSYSHLSSVAVRCTADEEAEQAAAAASSTAANRRDARKAARKAAKKASSTAKRATQLSSTLVWHDAEQHACRGMFFVCREGHPHIHPLPSPSCSLSHSCTSCFRFPPSFSSCWRCDRQASYALQACPSTALRQNAIAIASASSSPSPGLPSWSMLALPSTTTRMPPSLYVPTYTTSTARSAAVRV